MQRGREAGHYADGDESGGGTYRGLLKLDIWILFVYRETNKHLGCDGKGRLVLHLAKESEPDLDERFGFESERRCV